MRFLDSTIWLLDGIAAALRTLRAQLWPADLGETRLPDGRRLGAISKRRAA